MEGARVSLIPGKTKEKEIYEKTGMLPSQIELQQNYEPGALLIDSFPRELRDAYDGKLFTGTPIDIDDEFGMSDKEEQEFGFDVPTEEDSQEDILRREVVGEKSSRPISVYVDLNGDLFLDQSYSLPE